MRQHCLLIHDYQGFYSQLEVLLANQIILPTNANTWQIYLQGQRRMAALKAMQASENGLPDEDDDSEEGRHSQMLSVAYSLAYSKTQLSVELPVHP